MSYLLDTNAIIAILRFDRPTIARLNRHRSSEIFVSSIVLHELYFGAFKSDRSAKALDDTDLLDFQTLDFDREDARMSGNIRHLLARSGQLIGPLDLLIAGQALARDLTLVTRNTREFLRVDGLRVENWEA